MNFTLKNILCSNNFICMMIYVEIKDVTSMILLHKDISKKHQIYHRYLSQTSRLSHKINNISFKNKIIS